MAGKQDILKSVAASRGKPVADTTERQRAKPTRGQEAARQFAIDCAKLMHGDKCEEIVVMDLRGISPICDFFVIANGTSDRQMRAVADHIKVMGKERGEKPYGLVGYDESTWIIVDFVDVVIHLFDGEQRAFYDLESLWGDSERVDWEK